MGFGVGVFCMLYSWKTEQCYCLSAFLSLSASEICLWWFTPPSSVPTTYLTWTWEWISLAYLALPDLEHWKKTVMLHLTTLRLCMPWSPKASTSIEQVWHPVNYFPRFVSTTLTAFLPGNFFHYLQAAKRIALNIFNKHTTILPQSYLTSSHGVITTLLCNLIFWICDGKECVSWRASAW